MKACCCTVGSELTVEFPTMSPESLIAYATAVGPPRVPRLVATQLLPT